MKQSASSVEVASTSSGFPPNLQQRGRGGDRRNKNAGKKVEPRVITELKQADTRVRGEEGRREPKKKEVKTDCVRGGDRGLKGFLTRV